MESSNKYPLHQAILAADIATVRLLINDSIDLNEIDENGHSALHWAVFNGNIEIVELLLKSGANPNVFSDDGVTAKWRAKDLGLEDIEQLLTSYGGRIDTNENFDKASFKIFHSASGLNLPEDEKE
jgi:ankyrin repeat protein